MHPSQHPPCTHLRTRGNGRGPVRHSGRARAPSHTELSPVTAHARAHACAHTCRCRPRRPTWPAPTSCAASRPCPPAAARARSALLPAAPSSAAAQTGVSSSSRPHGFSAKIWSAKTLDLPAQLIHSPQQQVMAAAARCRAHPATGHVSTRKELTTQTGNIMQTQVHCQCTRAGNGASSQ